jgi:PadR family transcriptional regulator PadR
MVLFLGCARNSQRPSGARCRMRIAFPGQRLARPGLFSRGPSGTWTIFQAECGAPGLGLSSCDCPAANKSPLNLLLTKNHIPVYSMPVQNKPMTDTNPRDLFPGALEMMILESLRRQPAHGYALVQHIQQRSNNLLQVEEGSLYPALQRLLKSKLVKAEWGVSSTNRRVRTYQITASGMRHLEQQKSSFERMFEGIALVLNPGKSPAS